MFITCGASSSSVVATRLRCCIGCTTHQSIGAVVLTDANSEHVAQSGLHLFQSIIRVLSC